MLPSLVGQTLYLPISDSCDSFSKAPECNCANNCGALRGAQIFNSRPSLGFQNSSSSTWDLLGIYSLDIGPKFGFDGSTLYGYDRVGLSLQTGNVTLNNQIVSAFVSVDHWVGQLGLSPFAVTFNETERPKSLLQRFKDDGLIPSLSFGYQAGAAHRKFI